MERARQHRRLAICGDRLAARGGVPVQRIQVDVARVRFREAQLQADLIRVVVGAGRAREAIRALQRAAVGGARGPLIGGALLHAQRGPGEVGELAGAAVPAGEVISA